MAVFAAVCLVSVLPSATVWPESLSATFNGFGIAMWTFTKSLIEIVLRNFLLIAVIFWIGSRYGGNLKFKNVFPALSYCLIPMAVWGAAALAGAHLIVPLQLPYDGRTGADAGLSPNPLGFAGASVIFLIQSSFVLFFMAWSFVLFVKATKMSHGFGTVRAVAVLTLAIAATYALSAAIAILHVFFLPAGLP